jgi:hypothetical protein
MRVDGALLFPGPLCGGESGPGFSTGLLQLLLRCLNSGILNLTPSNGALKAGGYGVGWAPFFSFLA